MNPNQPPSGGPVQAPGPQPQQPYQQPYPPQPVYPGQAGPTPQSTQGQPVVQHGNPNDPYDFIMNPHKPTKPSVLANSSMVQRTLVIVGGITVLVILAVVVVSLLGKSSTDYTALTPVLQEQTELARIASAGQLNATQQQAQQLAAAVSLSMSSAKQDTLTYLAKNGKKIDPKLLTLKKSADDDKQLATALANSTYDQTFISIMQNDLAAYQSLLKKAYAGNLGPKGKKLLSDQYNGSLLLLQQSK